MSVLKNIKNRFKILTELFIFLSRRKKWWLLPIVIFLMLLATLIVVGGSFPLAPFIYTLF